MANKAKTNKSLTLDVAINELSSSGDGVAISEIDGERRAIFVPAVANGERVRVAIDDASARPLRGRLLEILTRASDDERVTPSCAYVDRCGGCDWMHLTTTAQMAEHARIVTRLLGVPLESVKTHPAPSPFGYRMRTRVHLQSQRRAPYAITVGMFAKRSHDPVEVDTCIVLDPIVDRARAMLSTWLEGAKGHGEARLALGVPPSGERVPRRRAAVLDLKWTGDDLPGAIFGRLERAVNDGALAGANVFSGAVRVPAKIGDPTPYLIAADGEPLRLAGFSQSGEEGNAGLAQRVAESARDVVAMNKPNEAKRSEAFESAEGRGDVHLQTRMKPDGPIVELHAGAGNLTVLLARDNENVIAVENDRDACDAMRANLATRKLAARARVVVEDAATFEIPRNARLVVLDPPRDGARAVATNLSKHKKKPPIIYVSCDPPTLARDVRVLVDDGGYAIASVETFEMFPQTSHVETIVVLRHGGET